MIAAIASALRAWKRLPVWIRTLCVLCAIALPVWAHFDDTAWDLNVYDQALASLQKGHDPYLDATLIQKEHHRLVLQGNNQQGNQALPYSYVYAPMTLPVLATVGRMPRLPLGILYWMMYLAGAFTAVAVCAQLAERGERPVVWALAALAVFFPGLLANGVILSGNIAYILYGAVLLAALRGWRIRSWLLFYAAVLCAACIKAPLLSLVLIAPLSDWRQIRPAMLAVATWVPVYALQMVVAPQLFRHYLEAVELQFSLNHDFGCSPAGLFSNILFQHGQSYSPGCYLVYMAYAVPTFTGLVYASRQFHRKLISLETFGPVLLVGVLLLNPRIMEYDSAAIALPMALILWRILRETAYRRTAYAAAAALFMVLNALSIYDWMVRKAIDGPLIVLTFSAGIWLVASASSQSQTSVKARATETELVTA